MPTGTQGMQRDNSTWRDGRGQPQGHRRDHLRGTPTRGGRGQSRAQTHTQGHDSRGQESGHGACWAGSIPSTAYTPDKGSPTGRFCRESQGSLTAPREGDSPPSRSRAELRSSQASNGRAASARYHGNGRIPPLSAASLPPPLLCLVFPPPAPREGRAARLSGGSGGRAEMGPRTRRPPSPPARPAGLTRSDCSSSPWHRRLRKDFCSRHSVCRVVRNTVPPTLSRTHLPQPPVPAGGAASPASILNACRGVHSPGSCSCACARGEARGACRCGAWGIPGTVVLSGRDGRWGGSGVRRPPGAAELAHTLGC